MTRRKNIISSGGWEKSESYYENVTLMESAYTPIYNVLADIRIFCSLQQQHT